MQPPIFVPMKRLTQATSKQRIIVRAIERRIAIYSPHTSYDCVTGGVNDWLAGAFDSTCMYAMR
jgi:putative NIF3 family GTP cyclohydrolase 1 type 2